MFLMNMPAVIVLAFALGTALLWFDVLFLKTALIGAILHNVLALLDTQYGWVFIVALVVITLVLFGMLIGQ
jgi:hypothetical protein